MRGDMAMWKKAAVIVMCLAFLLSMTGCGGSGKESKEQLQYFRCKYIRDKT